MTDIVKNVKGIMESIRLSQERVEKGTLSQKDQKNLIEMIGGIVESIDKRKELQENDKITQLKEHLGNIQEALFSKDPDKVISEQKEISEIADQLNYEVTFNNLAMGIFKNDDQIAQLQNEKADLVQQLIDLDMKAHGEISDITRQVLEVNHVNLDKENNEPQGIDPQMENASKTDTKEDTKDNAQKEKDATVNISHGFVGTVYLSENETNKTNFYGADLESVLNTIRKQREDPNSSMSKAKAVYIREQGATGASRKYDIASGKDITPIYLKLPFVRREEFKKITDHLKANGAVFNPHRKEWYVTREQDLSRFKAYLPEGLSSGVPQPQPHELYGVNVSMDAKGLKQVTQEVFDEIMIKRAKNRTEMDTLDFSGCVFDHVEFYGKETGLVKGFNFAYSQFNTCHFDHVQFEKCSFQGAKISNCESERAEFTNCDFSEADIGWMKDDRSSFAWCDFSKTKFRNGTFTESEFGYPDFDNAVMDNTEFINTLVSAPSMNHIKFTRGSDPGETAAYADRTRKALQGYDKSLINNKSFSTQNTKEHSHNADKTFRAPSGSLKKRLNENKIRADGMNKQNRPHEAKEPAIR